MCSFEQFGSIFFVPGQEGAAANEAGECELSQQKAGKWKPPRGGETLKGTQRKPLHMADTHILTHLFSCLPFVKWPFQKSWPPKCTPT